MTYKQVETSREIRLWITQVIAPVMVVLALNPNVRHKAKEAADAIIDRIKGPKQ